MAIFAATSVSDIVDELVTSLPEIEKITKCWSRLCVDDSQRRHAGRTSFFLILPCFQRPSRQRSTKPLGSPSDHALQDPESSRVPRSVAGFGRADHAICQQRSPSQDPDWLHLHEGPPPLSCMQLSHAGHPALNCSVSTRTTALASRGRHLCNRGTCPDCSHLSAAAVRLMESVRDRLVASWNKAVADAATTPQDPMPGVTLTPMAAAPVAPAASNSWRITEKAPPPQPSKRASFLKGTLEQARLACLTDDEIASIAAALTPVLEKEERSSDIGRSTKRGALPEARSSRTTKRGKAVLEPPPTSERTPLAPAKVTWVKPEEYAAYRARQVEHRKPLLQAGSTTTSASTTATTAATTADNNTGSSNNNNRFEQVCVSVCHE